MASSRARATSACARSRSATRASCSATRPAIVSISSWRNSGGAEVIATTAYTSVPSRIGNAMVSLSSSQTGPRASWARWANSELRGRLRVADVLVAVGGDRIERLDLSAAVRVGHEGPRSLPVVVQQHQGPGLHEHLAERGGLVGGAGDRLHEVVLRDLVLQRVLAGLQRGDQLVPIGVVGVAVQQGPRPARVVEQRGLAAQHPLDRAVAAHPLDLDRMLLDPARARLVEVRAELRAAVLVQDVEDGQRGQSLVS